MSTEKLATTRQKQKRTERFRVGLGQPAEGLTVVKEIVRETSDEQAELATFVDALASNYRATVAHYKRCALPAEEIQRCVETTEAQRERARNVPVRELTWNDLNDIASGDINEALEVWGRVRLAATDDLAGGFLAAQIVGASSPIEQARFMSLRARFLDGWQPRDGIERALIDMLAESFSLFQYWMEIAHNRAISCHDAEEAAIRSRGSWKLLRQSEADAIEQAHTMADRYNRMFLRTLRQLRDLRRYTPPVIVNNGGQVNVANQQLNVQPQK